LQISYTCRKCKKDYSKEEYSKRKFCTDCGSFLILTFRGEPGKSAINSNSNAHAEKVALQRAAESLRERVDSAREFEVLSEVENQQTTAPAFGSWLWSSEFDVALRFEKQLIKKYKGKTIEEAIPGEVVSNCQGECYAISSSCTSAFKKATYEESRRLLISELKVLPGIGPVREQLLKQQGYYTIEDLKHHPLWQAEAIKFMEIVDQKEVDSVQKWLWQRLPKSHPLQHYLAGFCSDEDFAIIDIETLGLSERPIILLGLAKVNRGTICTSQFLLRDIADEPGAIWALVSQLEPKLSFITYNGRSFDIPYIQQRLAYYGLDSPLNNPHFDILHFTRRALKPKLSDCRLDTVEKYIGIEREINIPGALVPQFYDTYLKTKNVGPLVPIVEHNKQDLLTLASLFSKLYEEWNL
jgi:uncharacterized protein YprB with RNaseH-like and TPR domain/DNA-directed RNA polymerase subunit RPC12/RpoP